MKKVYTMIAGLAATVTMMAAPATPAISPKFEEAGISDMAFPVKDFTVLENATRAAATPNLNNYMAYSYVSLAENTGGEAYESIQLEKISDTEVMIYGLCFNYGVKATYNAEKQTLTVAPQEVVPADEWNGEPLNLYVVQMQVNDSGQITGMPQVNSCYWTFAPEGVKFNDGTTGYVGGWLYDSPYTLLFFSTPSLFPQSRGYAFNYYNIFYQLEELFPMAGAFTFNESEWNNIGTSKFFDGWFAGPLLDLEYSPENEYDVVTYQNKENPGQFLLYKPYGPQSIAADPQVQINETPNAEGYIFIDATDPDCVLVRPNVYSGVTCKAIFDSSCMVELTSYEGIQYYFDEMDIEDIVAEAEQWEDELSTMSEEGVITIPRCRFGYVPTLEDENYWIVGNGDVTPLEMRAVITLPAAGIGSISSDVNAPVKYYNLQGVEISNPKAGDIVIKKQGTKSSKILAK